jgi:hypothetical protein
VVLGSGWFGFNPVVHWDLGFFAFILRCCWMCISLICDLITVVVDLAVIVCC